jgi:hypothetical protein
MGLVARRTRTVFKDGAIVKTLPVGEYRLRMIAACVRNIRGSLSH